MNNKKKVFAGCEHNKRKGDCRTCGKSYCKHNKKKSVCLICGGGGLCVHQKARSICFDCSPHNYCVHNRLKWSHCSRCAQNQLIPPIMEIQNEPHCIPSSDYYKKLIDQEYGTIDLETFFLLT